MAKYDLVNGEPVELVRAMAAATLLGIEDETANPSGNDSCGRAAYGGRTGQQIAEELCSHWRKGHVAGLRDAYRAGRWHVRAQRAG